jgi:hypothetical protein
MMITEDGYHAVVVRNGDWEQVKREARRHRWAPDRRRLRPAHSSAGQKERWLLGGLVLDRWAEEHGVSPLPENIVAKETDLHGAGNLLVPEDDLEELLATDPSARIVLLLAPPKQVGHDTTWFVARWIRASEVEAAGTHRPDLDKRPWLVRQSAMHKPDDLIAELVAETERDGNTGDGS